VVFYTNQCVPQLPPQWDYASIAGSSSTMYVLHSQQARACLFFVAKYCRGYVTVTALADRFNADRTCDDIQKWYYQANILTAPQENLPLNVTSYSRTA
jgi:hypothetical protein